MQIELFNFAKKPNSTKRPDTSSPPVLPADTLECLMKTSSSIQFPIVELKLAPGVYPAWNYAKIPDLNRYYFITNATYVRGVWEISLTVDVLASFRTDIGGTSMYIMRSSAQKTGSLLDDLYPALETHTQEKRTIKGSRTFGSGAILLNVANGDTNTGVTTYVMTVQDFGWFLDAIMINADRDNVKQAQDASLDVTHYQPIRYIHSAYWVPESYMDYTSGDMLSQMKLGNFVATGFSFWKANTGITAMTTVFVVNLPKHPQAATRGVFCNGAPYSEYVADLGPFGGISLDPAMMVNAEKIRINIFHDVVTGAGRVMIYTDNNGVNGTLLANIPGQWGVPLPVFSGGFADFSGVATKRAGRNTVGMGMLTLLAGGLAATQVQGDASAGAAASGLLMSGGQMVVSGNEAKIRGADAITAGAITMTGGTGSAVDHIRDWDLTATFYTIADDNNANNGRPLCKVSTPATLTGFMIAQKGLVTSSSASKMEIDAINAKMTGGFYYE